MPHYRLIYFDGRGTGEVIRQLFHLADIPLEDVRVSMEEWPKYKEQMPDPVYGHRPFRGKTEWSRGLLPNPLAEAHFFQEVDQIAAEERKTHNRSSENVMGREFKENYSVETGWSY